MKIAFLNLYSGSVYRGAETFVDELAQRLSTKFGYEVTVFQASGPRGNEDYRVKHIDVGIKWSKPDTSDSFFARFFIDYWRRKAAWFALKALPEIWKEKYAVVIPLNGGWQASLVRLITWVYRGRVVISGQSGMGWDDRNNLWNFPDCFAALSTKAYLWAKRVNRFVKVRYIPNGVDIKKFTPEGKRIAVGLKPPVILCVAALTKTKRVDLAIKAVAKMGKGSLLLVGDGQLREELERQGKQFLGERFKIIKVRHEKMPMVYRACDVFTIPSQAWYSFEIVLAEAMATNLPVVANNDPIRAEIVGEAGILVKPENIDEYSQALSRALTLEWGQKPRRQAEKFSWDDIAEKYAKLFKELVK